LICNKNDRDLRIIHDAVFGQMLVKFLVLSFFFFSPGFKKIALSWSSSCQMIFQKTVKDSGQLILVSIENPAL